MIKRLEITGAKESGDERLRKYVIKKIGRLDRYLPRHARESVHAEVKLKENKSQSDKKCTAEVVLYLPSDVIVAKDSTSNMFAAVDIVEAKLITQLKKYKARHTDARAGHKESRVRRALGKILPGASRG